MIIDSPYIIVIQVGTQNKPQNNSSILVGKPVKTDNKIKYASLPPPNKP